MDHEELLELMAEKGRKPANEREAREREERNISVVNDKIEVAKSMPFGKDALQNNTGRAGDDVLITEQEVKDIRSFMQGDRARVVPSGYVNLNDPITGEKIGVALQVTDANADAIEAGEFCGRCGDPQVDYDTERCTPISRGGLAKGCGFPRYRKM